MNQLNLYKALKKANLTTRQHILLVKLSEGKTTPKQNSYDDYDKMMKLELVDDKYKITNKGLYLLDKLENLFKKQPKTVKSVLGEGYKENIRKFREMFPSIKLPNGKYARASEKNLEIKFKAFFSNFNYSWDLILKATMLYIHEYEQKNWMYMRTSEHFVIKGNVSDLANYCDRIQSGEKIENNTEHFDIKVV